jgi:hypothetical protein
VPDESGQPCRHPQLPLIFDGPYSGRYHSKPRAVN